jgi:hypothetical protein
MGWLWGRLGPRCGRFGFSFTLLLAVGLAGPIVRAAIATPTNDEMALLVLANQFRSDPAAAGYSAPRVAPLAWSNALGDASRAHSTDMVVNQCFDHDSCDGTPWDERITDYYPSWFALGENIAAGQASVEDAHDAWVASQGHRENLLSAAYGEFGSGIAKTAGGTPYYTEDFGNRSGVTIPNLPAGTVLPRSGGTLARSFLVNYYASNGAAPAGVWALIGSTCHPLARVAGLAANGTYAADIALGATGCSPLVFQAITGSGSAVRFPDSGAILVAVNASCAERTATTPSVDCTASGGPAPTPTPTPMPTPEPGLSQIRIELRTSSLPSRDQIHLRATLPALASFDPSPAPLTVRITADGGQVWSQTFAASCGGAPCLRTNSRQSLYRALYAANGPGLTFTRNTLGRWRMRFWSHTANLGTLSSGTVTLRLEVGALAVEGSVPGTFVGRRVLAQ